MVLLTLGLSSSEAHGWGKAIAIAPIVIAVVVLGGFLLTERKASSLHIGLSAWAEGLFAGQEPCDAIVALETTKFCSYLVHRILHASMVSRKNGNSRFFKV